MGCITFFDCEDSTLALFFSLEPLPIQLPLFECLSELYLRGCRSCDRHSC